MSPKSPPVKKYLEKKPIRVKSIVSTDDDSDGKRSPMKKTERKTPRPDTKPRPEVKKEPKETERVYKF